MAFDPTDPDTKAALKAAVTEAVAAANATAADAATALQANNAKLLKELREAKKGAEIDPVKHAALEDKVAELEGALTSAQSAAKKQAKELTTQVETLTKSLTSESGFTSELLVDNKLSDALVKAGVAAPFLPAVKAMLKTQVTIATDGETRRAMVGDKPLAEFVTSWATGDEGKHYVAAPVNGGGGAAGGSGGGAGKTTIAAGDSKAFGANLVELAKGNAGSVTVV